MESRIRTLFMAAFLALVGATAAGCMNPGASPNATLVPTPRDTNIPTLEPGGGTPDPSLEVPPPIY